MDKRLKYEKFMNTDNIVAIDLHNGYTTIAIIGQNGTDNYDVCLMLKQNTVNTWTLIEEAEHLIFNATEKTIYSAILKSTSNYLKEGFFDHYINRYEYELKCFDIGNELIEKERLGSINVS